MYCGNTIPADWPQHANRSAYRKYALLPSWHIEEATALVAGYIPREARSLAFFPLHDTPDIPMPSPQAKTWGQLLDGTIGNNMALYARARRARHGDLPPDDLYVVPREFMRFCKRVGIGVPAGLRAAVAAAVRGGSRSPGDTRIDKQHRSRTVIAKRKAIYKTHTIDIASVLRSAGARVAVSQLQKLVEARATLDRTIRTRTYQGYLVEWRGSRLIARTLNQVLRAAPGRPTEEELEEQRAKLPREFADILWPTSAS